MTTNGDTGDIACDHYDRFQSDVALMNELGLKPIASASAWSRVLPSRARVASTSAVSISTRRLVDALLERGITAERDALSLGPSRRARRSRRLAQSATSPTGSLITPTLVFDRLATACRCGRRSMSRG